MYFIFTDILIVSSCKLRKYYSNVCKDGWLFEINHCIWVSIILNSNLPLYILYYDFMTGFCALNDIFLLTYNIFCYYSLLFVNKFYITQPKTVMEGNTNRILLLPWGSITMHWLHLGWITVRFFQIFQLNFAHTFSHAREVDYKEYIINKASLDKIK